jgi:hypothetical protein
MSLNGAQFGRYTLEGSLESSCASRAADELLREMIAERVRGTLPRGSAPGEVRVHDLTVRSSPSDSDAFQVADVINKTREMFVALSTVEQN